eukprot:2830512-Amphidinium_carterae.1
MVTPTSEEEGSIPTMAPGPMEVDSTTEKPTVDQNNPLDYHTSDEDESDSTIDRDIIDNMETIMRNALVSPQCSPTVLNRLHQSGLVLPLKDKRRDSSTTLVRETVIEMTLTPPIQRDSFNPLAAHNDDSQQYLWFMWLTEAQNSQFYKTGQVPGYKDTRGDNVHKHHRLHNTPDHCVNLHIHNRWNAAADNDNYGSNKPIYLLAWKTSVSTILAHSHNQANAHSSI